MSLPRADLRMKPTQDELALIKVFAEASGEDLGEFALRVLVEHVSKRADESILVVKKLTSLGLSGKVGE